MNNMFSWLKLELMEWLGLLLQGWGANETVAQLGARCVGLVILVVLAYCANFIAKKLILRVLDAVIARTRFRWDKAFQEAKVFTRMSHIAPALVIQAFGPAVLGDSETSHVMLQSALSIYMIVIVLLVLGAILNAAQNVLSTSGPGQEIPLKGFVQAAKLVGCIVGGILILSVVFGESPVFFLSGIGALTAVLLLVFRDALLGLVAGVMISANQMVRVGDWIEMPGSGADGDVMDVSLTTVKVRNWDRTITTVPSYDLISKSFKNWRGMVENKGRRIKRPIFIDMQTLGFIDKEMLTRMLRIERLRPYLESKLREVEKANQTQGLDMEVLCNGRRLTNIGTFRAYCLAYLCDHPGILQRELKMARQLNPTEHGLPLEIYAFTNDTAWVNYEGIQSDIFDHLFSIISEFGLRLYQAPSGHDMRHMLTSGANKVDRQASADTAQAVLQHEAGS